MCFAILIGREDSSRKKQLKKRYPLADTLIRSSKTIELNIPLDEAFQFSFRLLNTRDFKSITGDSNNYRISCITKSSFWSFGEKIEIKFEPANDKLVTLVKISSQPKLQIPFTVVDYGKNSENVETLAESLWIASSPSVPRNDGV